MLTFEMGDTTSARAYLAESLGLLRETARGRTAVFAIETCALLANLNGQNDLAVRLASATTAVRNDMGLPLERDSRLVDAPRAAIREALIELAASAENAGLVWSIDQTFREAETFVSPCPVIDAIAIDPDPLEPLSPREREVLDLLAQGRTDQQIADTLFISRRTASKHVSAILAKLEATNRTEAAAFASRESQP
jgi:DNA-binding CsgD family transcriptional regulator